MATYTEWEDAKSKKSGGVFLKLEEGKKYKVRLVGKAIVYWMHWKGDNCPFTCISPYIDADGKTLDPLMLAGLSPSSRYAIWVLNRDEGNKLQVMDFPQGVCDRFKAWKSNFNDEPGGGNGPDWIIEKKKTGPSAKNVKWVADYLDRTPFTPAEIASIKSPESGDLKKRLVDYYPPASPEKIKAMMAEAGMAVTGQAAAPKAPPAQAQATKPAVQAVAPAAPAAPAAAAQPTIDF